MTVYALLVFDRHCVATFAAAYNGTSLGPLGESTLPNVLRPADGPEATLAHRQSLAHTVSPQADGAANELPFDELAKLIYGIVVSIRVMTRQLAGIRDEDVFQSFSTSAYKLHYMRTSTSLHFVLVTSPMAESLRFVLQRLYNGPFLDHVVRNPLVDTDSHRSGKGIDSDAFRSAVDKMLRNLPIFT